MRACVVLSLPGLIAETCEILVIESSFKFVNGKMEIVREFQKPHSVFIDAMQHNDTACNNNNYQITSNNLVAPLQTSVHVNFRKACG